MGHCTGQCIIEQIWMRQIQQTYSKVGLWDIKTVHLQSELQQHRVQQALGEIHTSAHTESGFCVMNVKTFRFMPRFFLPFSMKSMTVNELPFGLLLFPPSWPDVCRLEESLDPSFNTRELSPSLPFFDLPLFFFEDMLTGEIFSTWKC